MKKLMWSVFLSIGALLLPAGAVEVGDTAPLFEARDQDGEVWTLKSQLGRKPIVVYFYPAAMTGGCTKQACSYRDYLKGESPEFMVVGISGDESEGLKYFQTSEKLNFPLLSDPGGAIAASYGVTVKPGEKTISRTVEGNEVELKRTATASRWTFVISPEGKVIYKSAQVKAGEDLNDVLQFLNQ